MKVTNMKWSWLDYLEHYKLIKCQENWKLSKKLKNKENAGLLRLAVTWSPARIARYDYDENLNNRTEEIVDEMI